MACFPLEIVNFMNLQVLLLAMDAKRSIKRISVKLISLLGVLNSPQVVLSPSFKTPIPRKNKRFGRFFNLGS